MNSPYDIPVDDALREQPFSFRILWRVIRFLFDENKELKKRMKFLEKHIP